MRYECKMKEIQAKAMYPNMPVRSHGSVKTLHYSVKGHDSVKNLHYRYCMAKDTKSKLGLFCVKNIKSEDF